MNSPLSALSLSSPDFTHGKYIPQEFTCEGANRAPRLRWKSALLGTKSFVLICDDPDAPAGTWVHWVVYNIPASKFDVDYVATRLEKYQDGTMQGLNSWPHVGYDGPCPPPGHGVHHYHFKLYALDTILNLKPRATKGEVEAAIKDHIQAQAELVGLYERKK